MGQPRISDTDYYVLIWECACSSPPTTQTHQPTRHALHPRNDARHTPPRPYCPRFCIPAGCWRARTAQPSQLTRSSYIRRARRPGATTDQKLALCPTQWSPPSTSSCQSSTQGPCRLGRAQQRAEELLLGPESTPSRSKKRPRRIRHPAQISLTGSIDLQHSNTQVNKACCARRAIDKGPGSSAAPVSVSPVAVSGVKPKAVSGVTGRARAGRPGTVSRPSRRSPARLRQPYPKKLATPRSQTTTDYSASQCPP